MAQAVFAAALALGAATPALAIPAVYYVTSNADSGTGSLRQALLDASITAGGRIVVDPSVNLISTASALPLIVFPVTLLTSAPLTIDTQSPTASFSPLTLEGNGAIVVSVAAPGNPDGGGSDSLTLNQLGGALSLQLHATSVVRGSNGNTGATGSNALPTSQPTGLAGNGGSAGQRGGAAVAGSQFNLQNQGSLAGGTGGKGGNGGAGGTTTAALQGANGSDGIVYGCGWYNCNLPPVPGGSGGTGGQGGNGGVGVAGAQGGVGGDGVRGTGFSLDNQNAITGGAGGVGGTGGAGAQGTGGGAGGLGGRGSSAGYYSGQLGGAGGMGGAGGQAGNGGAGANGAQGGVGGAGIQGTGFSLNNSGAITGGNGGAGGAGGRGGTGGAGGAGGWGGMGGTSGNGYYWNNTPGGAGGTGGNGGQGGNGGNGGNGAAGGVGGAGIDGASFTLRNTGTITGGNGGIGGAVGAGGLPGTAGPRGQGGTGGTNYYYGVTGPAGATGTIGTAGAAGVAGSAGNGAAGGAGVRALGNATISNAGTISGGLANGGTGARADAVQLSNGGNKLVLEAGSVIIGNVVSASGVTNGGDTLALGGEVTASGGNLFDLAGIGGAAQFRGFQKFSKEGSQEWTLAGSGASSWTVEAGTLGLADNAALAGSVGVGSNGAFKASNGTITGNLTSAGLVTLPAGKSLVVDGNFATSGTVKTAISDNAAGRLQASGTVTLGGSLVVDAAGVTAANTHNGNVAGIITGAAVAGQFASASDNSVLFNFVPVYSASSVDLRLEMAPVPVVPVLPVAPIAPAVPDAPVVVVTPAAPAEPAQVTPAAPAPVAVVQPAPTGGVSAATIANSNTPGLSAARVLDTALLANPGSALSLLFVPLSTQQQVSQAVTQTLPTLAASTVNVTRATLTNVNQIVQSRIDAVRGMSSGDALATEKGAWIKPFGSWANQSDRNGMAGYKSDTFGLVTGVDADLSKTTRAGAAFAYSRSDVDSRSSVAPQGATVDSYQVMAYGSIDLGNRTDVSWQADIGHNANKSHRQISFANLRAQSDSRSNTAHAGVALGRDMPLSDRTTFTPSVRADYTWIRDRGYTETGAGALNLAVEGRTTKSFVIGIDGKVQQRVGQRGTLVGNIGVGYDTMDQDNTIVSSFAGAPGAAFTLTGIEAGRVVTRLGVGYVVELDSGIDLTARYDAEHRSGLNNQTASVKVRWAF